MSATDRRSAECSEQREMRLTVYLQRHGTGSRRREQFVFSQAAPRPRAEPSVSLATKNTQNIRAEASSMLPASALIPSTSHLSRYLFRPMDRPPIFSANSFHLLSHSYAVVANHYVCPNPLLMYLKCCISDSYFFNTRLNTF